VLHYSLSLLRRCTSWSKELSSSANAIFQVDCWDLLEGDSDYRSAEVGDTVEIIWNGTQSIFIQPNDELGCNLSSWVTIAEE
jgi:hypothetical protein